MPGPRSRRAPSTSQRRRTRSRPWRPSRGAHQFDVPGVSDDTAYADAIDPGTGEDAGLLYLHDNLILVLDVDHTNGSLDDSAENGIVAWGLSMAQDL